VGSTGVGVAVDCTADVAVGSGVSVASGSGVKVPCTKGGSGLVGVAGGDAQQPLSASINTSSIAVRSGLRDIVNIIIQPYYGN
jgi:hypothetical protein